ncbi:MAG: hypothetical protein IVW56_13700 [Candidatus Binataceae bacterium]|nr:hypothetical protein [Candidatus Binataceae bacterium]
MAEYDQPLIGDVARRLQPRLEIIAERCVREIALAAPAPDGDSAAHAAATALAACSREVVIGFLHDLAADNPARALERYEAALAPLIGEHLLGTPRVPGGLALLLRSAHAVCRILHDEMILALAADSALLNAALLGYAGLGRVAAEAMTLVYFRLYEADADRRQRELTATRDAALEASRVKSAFVATMTHEIRTPLNVILGYTDLLTERLADLHDASGLQYAEPIRRSSRRLLETIGAILDLSRIESGAYPIAPRRLRLAAMVDRHVEDLRILARQKGLELDYRNDAIDALVTFDEQCLSNTIINLIQNAIKFTPHGTVSINIFREGTGLLSLAVRDSGVGIDPAYLPHLFEPFSREVQWNNPRLEGAGLGLALVKRYVELNGARVEVASVKNQGTVFTVKIPLAANCE